MIVRSLRWRLALAMTLIIAAVVAAAGLFSSMTVKREFNKFLIQRRADDLGQAVALIRETRDLRAVHARFGLRTYVLAETTDAIVDTVLADRRGIRVDDLPDGAIRLSRETGGARERMILRGNTAHVPGYGRIYFFPDERLNATRAFRISVDRWLIGGLAFAVLLAVVVMLTIFRRVFAPVERLTAGARALADGRLDTRVDVGGSDEIGVLAGAFNAMAEALERNERARRNMVSDVAHELRTPLTNIRVQLEAVQDGVLDADTKLIASLEEDAATLARLVDDLQQLSLGEAGQLRLELADVSLRELVNRALDGMRTGLTVQCDVEDAIVRVDARRMVQVIRNLVVNALTHAKSTVSVTANARAIRVSDDGPGVPPEHAPRIFDRFYRADASRSRTTGGAGLGLAIARQLVELHGGTLTLEGRNTFVIAF
jgi:signal transduction histidine kinase